LTMATGLFSNPDFPARHIEWSFNVFLDNQFLSNPSITFFDTSKAVP